MWTFFGHSWLNVVFFIISIISIVLAVIFYYKSLREKKPVFAKQTINLIKSNLTSFSKLQINYDGRKVDKLTLTKLSLWNSGKATIYKNDITTVDPLLIKTNGQNIIYDFEIASSNPANEIVITKIDDYTLSVSFTFLDFHNGVLLNIYHNGTKSDDVSIQGTLIGAKTLISGIKRNFFINRIDIITAPVNYLYNKNNIILKALGLILMLLEIPIIFPLMLIVIPLDSIYEKLYKSAPNKYYLHD
jgi:hypothetical protein